MTDYDHDLKFGTFAIPAAQGAREVIELAKAADRRKPQGPPTRGAADETNSTRKETG